MKAEKRLLVKELRALRDLGLYEGPLTYSDSKPIKLPSEPSPATHPMIRATPERAFDPHSFTRDSLSGVAIDRLESVSRSQEPGGVAVASEPSSRSSPVTIGPASQEDDSTLGNGRDDYFEGYCSAVLAELTERRAVVEEMQKVDPGDI